MPDTMAVNGAKYTVLHLLGKGKFSGGQIMSKRTRQYIGILAALAAYYLVHEGTHLLYALLTGVFKQIRLIVLCGFFGGGDMNGIALLCPEWAARSFFGVLLLANGLVFWKRVLPAYQQSFSEQ